MSFKGTDSPASSRCPGTQQEAGEGLIGLSTALALVHSFFGGVFFSGGFWWLLAFGGF